MDTASHSISRSELAGLLGRPAAPLLLDVRRAARFAESQHLVAGAQYCPPEEVARLAAAGPAREVVVYCVYGHEVSQEAARTLRAAGWTARYLAGGIEGGESGVDAPEDLAAWRAQALPLKRKQPGPGVTGEQPARQAP